ncbi:hypothetical protein [Moorena sp. SIO2C4]|uniref:hypothetical protein n=1 Tax=Moorena sp. SIO2C4 TaxID=2607824 RepID=UPI0013CC8A81|nr:hypothetical protein [Moorena sp. SIO2C4]NES42144.1 hypothetical protein [Moorena sp. SIO2C4]
MGTKDSYTILKSWDDRILLTLDGYACDIEIKKNQGSYYQDPNPTKLQLDQEAEREEIQIEANVRSVTIFTRSCSSLTVSAEKPYYFE